MHIDPFLLSTSLIGVMAQAVEEALPPLQRRARSDARRTEPNGCVWRQPEPRFQSQGLPPMRKFGLQRPHGNSRDSIDSSPRREGFGGKKARSKK